MTQFDDPNARWSLIERRALLGIMTAFATASAAAAEAIGETYGHWRDLHVHRPDLIQPGGPLVLIAVCPDAELPGPPDSLAYDVPESTRMLVTGGGASGVADLDRGDARITVAERLLERPARFVEDVVEPLTLFHLGRVDRQPLHAAAIARGGVAILLAAPSGTGKSTLAYAASRQGFAVLADEPVYVQLEPQLRVWGRRARLHLPPDARHRFHELRDLVPVTLPTGKTRIVMDSGPGPLWSDRPCLCLLRRPAEGAADDARLERIEPAAAVRALTAHLDPGFDLYADTIGDRIAGIAEAGGAWTLDLTDDPADAVPLLDELGRQVGAPA